MPSISGSTQGIASRAKNVSGTTAGVASRGAAPREDGGGSERSYSGPGSASQIERAAENRQQEFEKTGIDYDVERRVVKVGQQRVELPGTPPNWWSSLLREQLAKQSANQMPQAPPNEYGVPADWDWKRASQVRGAGPDGTPLPEGALGWTPRGEADFGGGISGWWKSIVHDWTKPPEEAKTVDAPWKTQGGALIRQGFLELNTAGLTSGGDIGVAAGTLVEGLKNVSLGAVSGLADLVSSSWSQLENVGEGKSLLAGAAQKTSAIVSGALGFMQLGAKEWKDYIGPRLLASQEIAATAPTTNQWLAKIESFTPGFIGQLYTLKQGSWAIAGGYATQEEWEALVNKYEGASSIAYTLWRHPALKEDYKQRIRAGEDPRVIALEMENPGVEAVIETLNDPFMILDFAGTKISMAVKANRAARTYARVASPAVLEAADVLKAARGEIAVAEAGDGLVSAVQDMYRTAEAGQVSEAGRRGIFSLTGRGKRAVVAERAGNAARSLLGHVDGDPDKFIEAVNSLALAASPDPIQAAEGIRRLRNIKVPANVAFAPASNELAITMRAVLYDESGEFASKRVANMIEKANGDPAVLAELFDAHMDDVLKTRFPTVTEQVNQNRKYAELLDGSADDAAKYLAKHPRANVEPSPFFKALAPIDEVAQRFIYKPASSVMGVLYMGTSPAYKMRNRLQGAAQILVDQGPIPAARALFGYGHENNLARIQRNLGGVIPSAKLGIGMAGGGPSEIGDGLLHFWSRSASKDEAMQAAAVVAESSERTMLSALQEGRAIPATDALGLFTGDERKLLVKLMREHRGNIADVQKAFRDATKGRNTAGNLDFLSDELEAKLRALRVLDPIQERVILAGSEEEALAAIDEIAANYRAVGLGASSESPLMSMADSDLGELGAEVSHAISSNVSGQAGDEAADLFERRLLAGDAAKSQAQQIASDVENLARRKIFVDANGAAVISGARNPAVEAYDASAKAIDDAIRPFSDEVERVTKQTYDEARNFTRTTWRRSGASKKLAANSQELRRLWSESGLGAIPSDLTGKVYRDALWENYYGTQNMRFAELRDFSIDRDLQKATALASSAGIEIDSTSMARLDDAWNTARAFDGAVIENGVAYGTMPARAFTPEQKRILETFRRGGALPIDEQVWASEAVYGSMNEEELARALGVRRAEEVVGVPPVPLAQRWFTSDLEAAQTIYLPGKQAATKRAALTYVDVPSTEAGGLLATEQLKTLPAAEIEQAGTLRNPESDYIITEQLAGTRQILSDTTPPPPEGMTRLYRAESGLHMPQRSNVEQMAELRQGVVDRLLSGKGERIPLVAPADDAAPSLPRFNHESNRAVLEATEELKQGVRQHWGEMQQASLGPAKEEQLRGWLGEARGRITEARATAAGIATEERNFILHDYRQRYGFDTLAGYVFPYQFWYSRTYAKWLKRAVMKPGLVASYGRYRGYLQKIHARLPDWWKYSLNSNELLGMNSEHPLYFNLEQLLNPLNGMTGVDFTDARKRVDWLSGTMDDINKFGPTMWTPYQLALAVHYQSQGQEDTAARWAGRLWQPTRTIRDLTALAGVRGGQGIELDPFVNYFSGGIDPHERALAGRMLGTLRDKYTDAELIDAARNQSGPIWEEAFAKAINTRSPNLLTIASPFVGGPGLKPRTQEDIQIDEMYSAMTVLMRSKPNVSPEEYRQAWDNLKERYPFMDIVLLSKKAGLDRDEAYAWSVLNRIPPGQTNALADRVGVPYEMLGAFYESKGDLSTMNESDRMHFMAAVIDLAAILEVPDQATKAEWTMARRLYSEMTDLGTQIFGDGIWGEVDAYYALNATDPDAARQLLRQNPGISAALDWKQQVAMEDPVLSAYYNSLEKTQRYYKGIFYDKAERHFGEHLWDMFDVYGKLKEIDPKLAKKYWKEHPELKQYMDMKDEELAAYEAAADRVASAIPESRPPAYRMGQAPEVAPQEGAEPTADEAWVASEISRYLEGRPAPAAAPQAAADIRAAIGETAYRLLQDGPPYSQALISKMAQLGITPEEAAGYVQ